MNKNLEKEGNHMIVPLLAGSYDITKKQSEENDRIFPYNSTSVTAGFQRVRNTLASLYTVISSQTA